ncbi:flagellar basal body P-ring formation chaperone FlgA [Balneatrix alpica]|uniref:flagellar basal body P-ring formation chaperone FlgA n=1 Tax=Balneatrix alpica TaxID=75684 RepID=UPI0027383684|nr:flagellar basal body P-ring formation chaperone FlgA [Balneatrix alpica]
MQFSQAFAFTLLLTSTLIASFSATAATSEDLTQAVINYLAEQLEANPSESGRLELAVAPLDSRLRLHDCAQPLEVSHAGKTLLGRLHIKVSCAGPVSWSVYVGAEIKLWRPVVILATNLSRNQMIDHSSIKVEEQDVSGLRQQYYTSVTEVLGYTTKRHLSANTVLGPDMLEAPMLVKKGTPVTINAIAGSVRIHTQGVAQTDGSLGQVIQVQNLNSQRIVRAKVIGPGQVQVGP